MTHEVAGGKLKPEGGTAGYPHGARFEIHVVTDSLSNPGFYLIDRLMGKTYPCGMCPDYVLDMIFSRDAEFLENFTVIEEHDGLKPLIPTYGTGWKLYIPPEEKWWKGHPRLRRLFQEMPYIYVELNDEGHSREYRECVLEPLYISAASS